MKYLIIFFYLLLVTECQHSKYKYCIRTFNVETTALSDSILSDTIAYSSYDTMYFGENNNIKNLWHIDKSIRENWTSNYTDIKYRNDVIISYDTTYFNGQIQLYKYFVITNNPEFVYYGYYSPFYGTVFWKSTDGFDKIRLVKIKYIDKDKIINLKIIQDYIDSLRSQFLIREYENLDSSLINEIENEIPLDFNN
jgi:hypothetical protein